MRNQDNRFRDAANPSAALAQDLRQKAEAHARELAAMEQADSEILSPEKIRETLHELRVHQIELEMQNDELRMAQALIEAGRERYIDLYDLAPVGYCTLSEKGIILEANLTIATLLGTTRILMVRQMFSKFIFKDDQDIYYRFRNKLSETKENEPAECELRLVKPDNSLIWAELTATAGQEEGDGPLYRLVLSDITQRKHAEAEKTKLEGQLQQALKIESLGRLAGGVAHDFNNMLGVILGNLELALERVKPNDPLNADLEEIRKAAQRSANLTRQLLAFARKQTISPKVLDLNSTVEVIFKMLRQLIGEDITLDFKPGEDLWTIKMDPSQIDQILANLCINARDAIAGVGRITVETRNAAYDEEFCNRHANFIPGEYVQLIVNDDGCGMDAETLLLVFDPFFTTKEIGKGTGLGLATVYGIVKQNNGCIDVFSNPGQGTTFNIYLPRYVDEKTPLPVKAPVPPLTGGHETILLVEDEPAILKMTTIMLVHLGYTVLAANSPAEAIRLAKENTDQIALLITDVIMPEMNGLDLAKNLLNICPNLNCLFMSGYPADIIAQHGVLEKGQHFIQKPFSMKALGPKVREAMETPCPK